MASWMTFTRCSALLFLCLGIAHASTPAPLVLDLTVSTNSNPIQGNTHSTLHNKLARRNQGPDGNTISLPLDTTELQIFANLSIGTPPQPLKFIIDTNSADLVVHPSSYTACSNASFQCSSTGTYNANKSSTYHYNSSDYSIDFATGYHVAGDYATDVVTIAGTSFDEMVFAIAYDGNLTTANVLGIGYVGIEASALASHITYANLPARMYNEGISNIIGYSLWFNTANDSISPSDSAKLVFGGVDTNQFYGTLETLPIEQLELQYLLIGIQLDRLSVTNTSSQDTTNVTNNFNIILESSSTSFIFKSNRTEKIVSALGFPTTHTYSTIGFSWYIEEYSKMDNSTTLDFTFGTTTISVPISEMIVPFNHTWGALNILASDTIGVEVLSLPFFRNAYTVFDYSHNQVSLAPLVRGNTESNITAISENGVVGLTGVSASSSTGGGGGLSGGAKAGIAVGVILGVGLVLACLAFYFLRRRRQRRAAAGEETFPGKAELPAAEAERNIVEKDGTTHGDRVEAPGDTKAPVELSPGLDGKDGRFFDPQELSPGLDGNPSKNFGPQELPGDTPKPLEMPTAFNRRESEVKGTHKEGPSPLSEISDLSGATAARETDLGSTVSPEKSRSD